MHTSTTTRNFPLGQMAITATARESLDSADVAAALARHARGDWGDIPEKDRAENELSITEGFRLLSSYKDRKGQTFWIITEADRSVTTVLLPEDY